MTFTYRKIELPVEPSSIDEIHQQYPWPADPETGVERSYFAHYRFDHTKLNPVFVDIMGWGGMKVKHSEVFYRPGTGENFDAFIHVDGHKVVECVGKINWVIGAKGNVMNWFKPVVEIQTRHQMITNAGTKYLTFLPEDVERIDTTDMHGLYVVNAGIPHSVDMTAGSPDEPRICLSIVPTYIQTPEGKKPNDNVGGDEIYLRLIFGSAVMGLTTVEHYVSETKRLTGAPPSDYAMEMIAVKTQERIKIDLERSA